MLLVYPWGIIGPVGPVFFFGKTYSSEFFLRVRGIGSMNARRFTGVFRAAESAGVRWIGMIFRRVGLGASRSF